MRPDFQARVDELVRKQAKAKKQAKRPAPADPGLGSQRNPIPLDPPGRIGNVRRREAEARERAIRPTPQDPGLRSLDPPVRPWVIPNRGQDAPAPPPGRRILRPRRRGLGPGGPPRPGVDVIDVDAPVALVNKRTSAPAPKRAGRASRLGSPNIRGPVIDLEALSDQEAAPAPANRGGRKVRFASPEPKKEVVDLSDTKPGNKRGHVPPGPKKVAVKRMPRQVGKKTRFVPPKPSKVAVDQDPEEGPSSSRAGRDRAQQIERPVGKLINLMPPRPIKVAVDQDPEEESSSSRAARVRAQQIERQIVGYRSIPPLFDDGLEERLVTEKRGITQAVVNYYRKEMNRGDARTFPPFAGQPSSVEEVLREDALERLKGNRGPGWRPVKSLGSGGQGGVTLWQKNGTDGAPIRLATKDMTFEDSFFQDYNNEGNMTRRMNDAGCENVIKVYEWALLERPYPRHRIAYEVAEHGDLSGLLLWYGENGLVLPEHFIWHVWHSLANALTYQALGHNASAEPVPDWDEIVHGDIKPPNILLCAPDPNAPTTPHAHYPAMKLADYGLAYTIPLDRDDVRAFKSRHTYGTENFMAPEVTGAGGGILPYALHGVHTDVYSAACVVRDMLYSHRVRFIENSRPGQHNDYSDRLLDLMDACGHRDGRQRPTAYELLQITGEELRRGREAFEAGVRTARTGGANHGFYPGKVLVTPEERRQFEDDPAYQLAYEDVNAKWVFRDDPNAPRVFRKNAPRFEDDPEPLGPDAEKAASAAARARDGKGDGEDRGNKRDREDSSDGERQARAAEKNKRMDKLMEEAFQRYIAEDEDDEYDG